MPKNQKDIGHQKKAHGAFATFSRDAKLQVKQYGHTMQHNALAWVEHWKTVKLGTYGEDIGQMGRKLKFEPYNLETEKVKYTQEPEELESMDFFRLSTEQRNTLRAIDDEEEREDVRIDMASAWVTAQKQKNASIRTKNIANAEELKKVINKAERKRDSYSKIFQDMEGDMTEMAHDVVRRTIVRRVVGDDADVDLYQNITYDEAVEMSDFIWILEAAIHGLIKKGADADDAIELIERHEEIKKSIKDFKQGNMEWSSYTLALKRQWEQALILGLDFTDLEKVVIVMGNINPEIFRKKIETFRDPEDRRRKECFQSYEALIKELDAVVRSTPDALLLRARGRERVESSFVSGEKGEKSCNCCGEYGAKFHLAKECPYLNPKYSVAENCEFYRKNPRALAAAKQKVLKAKENATSTGKSSKPQEKSGTKVRIPSADDKKEEKSYVMVQTSTDVSPYMELDLDIMDGETTECSYLVARSRHRGVARHEVDFTLDTATVSGVVHPADIEVITNIIDDPVTLIGVGNMSVVSEKSGTNIFGKSRVINQTHNLVSHYEVCKKFQVINPNPDCMYLRDWSGKNGREWYFYRDEDRYGDVLLHCTVDRKLFTKTVGKTPLECLTMYQADPVWSEDDLTAEQKISLQKVDSIHEDINHASAAAMIRTVKGEIEHGLTQQYRLGVTVEEIELWQQIRGKHCRGCIRGKLTEHNRVTTTKDESYEPGETAGADLMFVEVKSGVAMKPFLVTVDKSTKLGMVTTMENKSSESLRKALSMDQTIKKNWGKPMKYLEFDREPSVIEQAEWMRETLGITLKPKAAGQHVGEAERYIRTLKDSCRATKMGVYDKLGFMPPTQWNTDLVLDVNSCLNSIVKYEETQSPIELFTGIAPDRLRGLRGHAWGSVVLTKPPQTKAATTIDKAKADYSMVVRRYWDRSGILKVYQVSTGRYAYRFQAKKVSSIPTWVLDKLSKISADSDIIFESESFTDEQLISASQPYDDTELEVSLNDEELHILDNLDTADAGVLKAAQVRELAERVIEPADYEPAYDFPLPSDESAAELADAIADTNDEDLGSEHREALMQNIRTTPPDPDDTVLHMPRYPVRERVPRRFIDHYVFAMTYEKALRLRADKAVAALDTEIDNWENNEAWTPIYRHTLTDEQQSLILTNMMNFVEKYDQAGNHIKDKVRVLLRGDQEWASMIGETHGPVCRVESLYLILQIAVACKFKLFRIDVVAAFLKTPMNDSIKHRWMYLQRNISRRLVERNPGKYSKYLDGNGRILMEMNKLGYGYKEACHYFGEVMIEVLIEAGMERIASDTCVWSYRLNGRIIHCGTTVDDICGVADSDETIEWFHQQMIKGFKDVVLETGNSISWIGMQIDIKDDGAIELSQRKYLRDIVTRFNITKTAPSPALSGLYDIDPDSPGLSNQKEYMSAVQSAAFAANRTVPQIKVAVNYCATRFGKATEEDWVKIMRVLAYINTIKEEQCVRLEAVNIDKVIATADASYAIREDCKSASAGAIGLEGMNGMTSYFIWIHKIQPIVTRSSAEAELVAASYVVEYALWVTYMLSQLGYGEKVIELEQDNTASINFINRGRGTFQRTKHIKVREFWLKMLLDSGEMIVKYVPTAEMTADILSKPLTGATFSRLLNKLIGWSH